MLVSKTVISCFSLCVSCVKTTVNEENLFNSNTVGLIPKTKANEEFGSRENRDIITVHVRIHILPTKT